MAGAIDIKYNKVRNPQLREFIEKDFHDELFDVTTGHDHDGVNSPTLSPAAVIANNSIISAKIVDGAVIATKIGADAVTTVKILDGAVTTDKLGADAVIGTKIADNAVDSEHIKAGAIDTAHIGDLQVTKEKIAADAIDGTKIGDDSIDSEHIVDGAVDLAHMSANSVDSDQYVDGSIDTVHLAATTTPTAITIADPGTGKAIPVTGNGNVALTLAGAGETNTLAVPTFAGQILTISADTVAASAARTVTVASAINATGNNTLTFDAAGGFISLYGIKLGETFAWRVLASDGVTLSTVG